MILRDNIYKFLSLFVLAFALSSCGSKCFTCAKDKAKEVAESTKENCEKAAETVKEKSKEVAEATKEKCKKAAEVVKEKSKDLAESTKEKAEKAADATKDAADATKEKSKEIKEKASEKSKEMKQKASEKAEEIKDAAKSKSKEAANVVDRKVDQMKASSEELARDAKIGTKEAVQKVKEALPEKVNIIMIGAPASGKGTHAAKIRDKYNFGHLSVGDVMRNEVKSGSYIGKCIKESVAKGELVDDKLVLLLLRDEMRKAKSHNKAGVILDGFPRTIKQARELEEMTKGSLNIVINVVAKDDILVERVRRRAFCGKCNAKLTEEKECSSCFGDEVIREDDDLEVFKERLRIHHLHSDPIVDYLKKSPAFKVIDIDTSEGKDINKVSNGIFSSIDKLMKAKKLIA